MTEDIRSELERFLKVTKAGYKLFVPAYKPTHIAKTELQNFISIHPELYRAMMPSSLSLSMGCAIHVPQSGIRDWSEKEKVSTKPAFRHPNGWGMSAEM